MGPRYVVTVTDVPRVTPFGSYYLVLQEPDGTGNLAVLDQQPVFCNVSTVKCVNCEKHPVTTVQFVLRLHDAVAQRLVWKVDKEGNRVRRSEDSILRHLTNSEYSPLESRKDPLCIYRVVNRDTVTVPSVSVFHWFTSDSFSTLPFL